MAKLYVSQNSGSSALLSEAVHTAADIGNQLLLRLGIARSNRAPTADYPYGFMKDKFIFSLISAVGVFCIGSGASIINGAYSLTDTDHDVDNFGLNFIVLAISFVVEGFSCFIAVRALSNGADEKGVTFLEYLDSGSDPAAVAVMAEDGAAVIGVTIAATATWLVQVTDWQAWDGLGSILVGILLAFVALFLIQRNRSVLIGRSMNDEDFSTVMNFLNNDSVVNHVYDARSEEIGPGVYRFTAELDFDGEAIAARHLKTIDAESLHAKFMQTRNAANPSDTRAFAICLKEYGTQLVQAVGAEVDRIEGNIQRLVPGVRYVDLEADRGRFWLARASIDGDEDLARRSFDLSQLTLDSVMWARESDRLDFLLADPPVTATTPGLAPPTPPGEGSKPKRSEKAAEEFDLPKQGSMVLPLVPAQDNGRVDTAAAPEDVSGGSIEGGVNGWAVPSTQERQAGDAEEKGLVEVAAYQGEEVLIQGDEVVIQGKPIVPQRESKLDESLP